MEDVYSREAKWNYENMTQRRESNKFKKSPVTHEITEKARGDDKSTQTVKSSATESKLPASAGELDELRAEIMRLEIDLPFGVLRFTDDDYTFKFFSGVDRRDFDVICEHISKTDFKYVHNWKPIDITLRDQIFLTLTKLRLNEGYEDLACSFNINVKSVENIFLTFLNQLHALLCDSEAENVPLRIKNLSIRYRTDNYKSCDTFIDCVKYVFELPEHLGERKRRSGSYNYENILKGIVGMSPNGAIVYVSKLYSGFLADKDVVRFSRVTDHFKPEKLILMDPDFLPEAVLTKKPQILGTNQFTSSKIGGVSNVDEAKKYMERAIEHINFFHIVHCFPNNLFHYASKIFELCAALVGDMTDTLSADFEADDSDSDKSDG